MGIFPLNTKTAISGYFINDLIIYTVENSRHLSFLVINKLKDTYLYESTNSKHIFIIKKRGALHLIWEINGSPYEVPRAFVLMKDSNCQIFIINISLKFLFYCLTFADKQKIILMTMCLQNLHTYFGHRFHSSVFQMSQGVNYLSLLRGP